MGVEAMTVRTDDRTEVKAVTGVRGVQGYSPNPDHTQDGQWYKCANQVNCKIGGLGLYQVRGVIVWGKW